LTHPRPERLDPVTELLRDPYSPAYSRFVTTSDLTCGTQRQDCHRFGVTAVSRCDCSSAEEDGDMRFRRRAAQRHLVIALLAAALLCACSSSGGSHAGSQQSQAPTTDGTTGRNIDVAVGALNLPGTLVVPAGPGPFPAIVMVSGSGPNDRDETMGPNHPFRDLANGLEEQGIATLRYDKRTKTDPDAIDPQTFTPTQEYVPDALAAVGLLREQKRIDPRRIVVLGHSQGGTLTPAIAAAEPSVAGIILMAAGAQPFGAAIVRQSTYIAGLQPPNSATDAQLSQLREQADLLDDPNLPLTTPASSLFGGLGPQYWRDISHSDPIGIARSLAGPILLLQGERDYQVTVADDLALWHRGLADRDRVTEKRYPNANHFLLDGSGPPNPAEYDVPGTVDPQVVSDIAIWMKSIP
jgi:pimeloyl-ACP methyl ester carboxylesterase